MATVKNVTFDEIHVGASATYCHTISQSDIELFALMTGDVDPFHIEGAESGNIRPYGQTTEAIGAAAMIAAALGTRLPGPGMVVLKQDLSYQGTITSGDVMTATVTVRAKRVEGARVDFDCECVNQRGEVLVAGKVTVAAPTKAITYTDLVTPRLELRWTDTFVKLFEACAHLPAVSCAVVHPCDRDSLLGAIEAAKRGFIVPVLVGPEDRIRATAQEANVDLSPYRIVPTHHSHESATRAVELARSGEIEALMKGSLHTDEVMAAVVAGTGGLRTSRRVSHVFVMDVPTYSRLLLITDAAINIAPTLEEKVDIVQNAIDLARVLGIDQPRVAILSAVETVTPKIPSTVEAAALCKMADRRQITGGLLEGPLAFDNAVSARAARTKGIVSPVAGQADVLVVPDLEAGNMLAKQLSYLAGAESAGIVVGARVPIVLTSRADTVRSRLASTAVLVLVAHARRQGTFPIR